MSRKCSWRCGGTCLSLHLSCVIKTASPRQAHTGTSPLKQRQCRGRGSSSGWKHGSKGTGQTWRLSHVYAVRATSSQQRLQLARSTESYRKGFPTSPTSLQLRQPVTVLGRHRSNGNYDDEAVHACARQGAGPWKQEGGGLLCYRMLHIVSLMWLVTMYIILYNVQCHTYGSWVPSTDCGPIPPSGSLWKVWLQ